MENHNWEYVYDYIADSTDYIESMTEGTYIDDEYYEEENNQWADYYEDISDELEY